VHSQRHSDSVLSACDTRANGKLAGHAIGLLSSEHDAANPRSPRSHPSYCRDMRPCVARLIERVEADSTSSVLEAASVLLVRLQRLKLVCRWSVECIDGVPCMQLERCDPWLTVT
jgi:hypothetical protein